jgi:hypothetical protein
MNKLLMLALISVPVVLTGACASTVDMSAPDVAACNVGGPLGRNERITASEPKPQQIPGRPADCVMGPDGVLRLQKRS